MNKQEVLTKLFQRMILERIKSLEENASRHKNTIDECNSTVSSILEDKSLKSLTQSKLIQESLSESYNTAPNPSKNSDITEGNNTGKVLPGKQILVKEKSLGNLKSSCIKPVQLIRSNTKANLAKPKDSSIMKPATPLIPEKKPELKSLKSVLSKAKTPNNKANLNKTFQIVPNSNKIKNPSLDRNQKEKSKTEISKKILSTEENLRNSMKHTKNISYLSNNDEKTNSYRKNSHLSPKAQQKHPSKSHHESLPVKEKDYMIIQDESENNALTQTLETENPKLINEETKCEKIKICYEEILKNYNSNISKFVGKFDLLKMRLNRSLNKICLKSMISLKKDELIKNEKNIQNLREKYSMDDLMREPDSFSLSMESKEKLQNIDESCMNLFSTATPRDDSLINVFKIFFQIFNCKNIKNLTNEEFRNYCSKYFAEKGPKETVLSSIKNIDVSDQNLLNISKLMNKNQITFTIPINNSLVDFILCLINDIKVYSGIAGDNTSNACILSALYRLKFEDINVVLEKIKLMEYNLKKN